MKRLAPLLPLGLAIACAGAPATPARVEIAVAPPPTSAEGGAPQRCTIVGAGELRHPGHSRLAFVVHAERTGDAPIAVITMSENVGVTWSELPSADAKVPGRAHVLLGGGALPSARLGGWASLEERSFQTRRDAIVVPDHVWLLGGLEVQLRGVRGDALVVARPWTGLAVPGSVEATTACGDVAYEIDRIDPEVTSTATGATMQAKLASIALRTVPSGPVVFTITQPKAWRFPIATGERRDGFVRVWGTADVLRFDGWIAESEVEPLSGSGQGRLGGSHQTRPPTIRFGRPMMVAKETPLYLGKTAEDAKEIGVLEVQARLDVTGSGKRVEVRFTPMILRPPDDFHYYADEADLGASGP